MSQKVYIVSAKRTPIGSFLGSLSSVSAPYLGAASIKANLHETRLSPENIDECIMGNVLTSGVGQAPARQAAIYAGLPTSVSCMTINKVCGSGLKAVMLATDSIRLGRSHIVIAGGQENMSLAPHLLMNSRSGYRLGNIQSIDSMVNDGLWDPYNDFHMGNAAELCVNEYKFSRQEQDEYAKESYKRSQSAIEKNLFSKEITSFEVKNRSTTLEVSQDEEPNKVNFDKLSLLRPAFIKEGTITAANASSINDGASSLMITSEEAVKKYNLTPLAEILTDASFSQEPKWFTTAPVGSIQKALKNLQMETSDIDLWEINEAFSAVAMAALRDLKLNHSQVNVMGGAVSLGHPIGASGARILTTLVHSLHTLNKELGCASLCIGGGEAVAMIIKRV